jgi:hypothetical protein
MGCPCRQIRQAVAHLPGGRALLGLLPELPRSKGTAMRMQTTPGQTIHTIAGHHYYADAAGIIEDVDPADVGELQRVGCRRMPPPPPVDPPEAAQQIMREPKPLEPAAELRQILTDSAAGHHEAPEHSEQ